MGGEAEIEKKDEECTTLSAEGEPEATKDVEKEELKGEEVEGAALQQEGGGDEARGSAKEESDEEVGGEKAEEKAEDEKADGEKGDGERPEIKVGDLVEATFEGKGTRYFDAKVLAVNGDSVTLKWTYDDDVPDSTQPIASIKTSGKKKEVAAEDKEAGDEVDADPATEVQVVDKMSLSLDEYMEAEKITVPSKERSGKGKGKEAAGAGGYGGWQQGGGKYTGGYASKEASASWQPSKKSWDGGDGAYGGKSWGSGDDHAAKASAGSSSSSDLRPGDLVDAKYPGKKDRRFEAKVVSVWKTTVKVKWTYDDNVPDSDLPISDVVPKAGKSIYDSGSSHEKSYGKSYEKSNDKSYGNPNDKYGGYGGKSNDNSSYGGKSYDSASKTYDKYGGGYDKSSVGSSKDGQFKVGDLVEAKFGKKDRLFEAKVLKVNDWKSTLTLQWTYDESVPASEVPIAEVTAKAGKSIYVAGAAGSYGSKSYDKNSGYGGNDRGGSYDKSGGYDSYAKKPSAPYKDDPDRDRARGDRRSDGHGDTGSRRDTAPQRPAPRGEDNTVVVSGIDGLHIERRDLETAFEAAGRVFKASVKDGIATIVFEDERGAREAIRRFNGGQLNDRTIRVVLEADQPRRVGAGRAIEAARSRSRHGAPRPRAEPPRRERERDRDRDRERERSRGAGRGAEPPRGGRAEPPRGSHGEPPRSSRAEPPRGGERGSDRGGDRRGERGDGDRGGGSRRPAPDPRRASPPPRRALTPPRPRR